MPTTALAGGAAPCSQVLPSDQAPLDSAVYASPGWSSSSRCAPAGGRGGRAAGARSGEGGRGRDQLGAAVRRPCLGPTVATSPPDAGAAVSGSAAAAPPLLAAHSSRNCGKRNDAVVFPKTYRLQRQRWVVVLPMGGARKLPRRRGRQPCLGAAASTRSPAAGRTTWLDRARPRVCGATLECECGAFICAPKTFSCGYAGAGARPAGNCWNACYPAPGKKAGPATHARVVLCGYRRSPTGQLAPALKKRRSSRP
jgi:hypothetical protein